ncbi:hypothetical protein ROT00_14020 [Agromyces mediolanus]|uniref:hypothetical protein n=1 Tax=Agromyces mediolanus TaxID=41986 RepID=UPI0038335411
MHLHWSTRLLSGLLAFVLVLGLNTMQATVAAAPASAAGSTTAVCWKPNPAIRGSQTTVWTGKNPRTCRARYQLYDVRGGRPVLVLDVKKKAVDSAAFWKAVAAGYAASQKWCSQNSLTCTLIVSVGIMLVSPLAAAARG